MATTKKSSKANTKTAKGKAAKSRAASARAATKKSAAKTTAPVAARGAATKAKQAPTKVTKSARTTSSTATKSTKISKTSSLRKLNQLSAVLHIAGAVLAAVFMGNATLQFFSGLMTRDELASGASTVFIPAIHHLYDIEIRWIVVALLLVGAIVPLINVFRSDRYQATLKARRNPLRWASTGIVGGAMVAVVAALSGVEDIMTLKVIGGLVIIAAALGWLAERQNGDKTASPDKTACSIGVVSGLLPWLIILTYAFGTPLWGMVRYPWYVYALYASVLAGFAAYTVNGCKYIRRLRVWANYETLERNYVVIDMLTRVSFAVILIVGLAK